jgi:hypothetical protein
VAQHVDGRLALLFRHVHDDALCSEVSALAGLLNLYRVLHSSKQMYLLDYFTYRLHPFGLDKNSTEVLPRKPTLDEVLARSNIPGTGSHYFDIPDRAAITEIELEDSERY